MSPPIPAQQPAPSSTSKPITPSVPTLLITHSTSDYVSFVDPITGSMDKLSIGIAPFALSLSANGRAYVSTAEGVAIVDTKRRTLISLVPYQTYVGTPQYGEYRPGGMGISVSPDGRYVYVGVYVTGNRSSQLEILDTHTMAFIGHVPVGIRPFDVVVSKDGTEVYSIDHDSYSVTVVDPVNLRARKLDVAPFGRGGFEKPHYASVREDGRLLLPFQGRGLVILDPASGKYVTEPLTGNTHQEGVALTTDGQHMLILGIGAAGSATGTPNLTVLDVSTMAERIIPLERMHQMVASSRDGRYAYLTGGVTFANTGWNGLTIVDLEQGATRELSMPDYPLDVELLLD